MGAKTISRRAYTTPTANRFSAGPIQLGSSPLSLSKSFSAVKSRVPTDGELGTGEESPGEVGVAAELQERGRRLDVQHFLFGAEFLLWAHQRKT